MSESQAAATRFCARAIGLIFLIIGAVVVVRYDALVRMMPAILDDEALAFVIGIFTLIVGVILFAAHHHWSSAAAVAVSLIGLLTMLRGLLLMLAPRLVGDLADQMLAFAGFAWIAGGVAILLGLWLSWAGWFAKSL